MKTDGLFSTHIVTIKARLNEPFYIVPIGDIHRESPMHAHGEFQADIKNLRTKKNHYFLGMGDFCDGCSTSERAVLLSGGIHDTTKETLRGVYRGIVKTLANELGFMRGKTIGMLGGNHFYELENGENTDHVLSHALGAKYLGCTGFIRLVLDVEGRHRGRQKGTVNSSVVFDIFANHGKGGGKTVGATFNSIEDMMKVADADLYLMGHTHGKGTTPSFPRMKLVPDRKGGVTVRARTPHLGRTGSYLKGYENGKTSYTCDALYPALALGHISFEITPVRIQKDGVDRIELQVKGTA
jgi:hypothetical protein